MDHRSNERRVKRQLAGSDRFDQIDPHRHDQHAPAPNPGESAAGGFLEGKSKK